jgi:hypothetical protein
MFLVWLFSEAGYFEPVYDRILQSFGFRTRENRKNVLSKVDMETLGVQSEVLCQLAAKAKKIEPYLNSYVKLKVLNHMILILYIIASRGK